LGEGNSDVGGTTSGENGGDDGVFLLNKEILAGSHNPAPLEFREVGGDSSVGLEVVVGRIVVIVAEKPSDSVMKRAGDPDVDAKIIDVS